MWTSKARRSETAVETVSPKSMWSAHSPDILDEDAVEPSEVRPSRATAIDADPLGSTLRPATTEARKRDRTIRTEWKTVLK